MVIRVVSNYLRLNNQQYFLIDTLAYHSKNLYNVALYNVRQHYREYQEKVAGDSVVQQITSSGRVNRPVRIRLIYEQPSYKLNCNIGYTTDIASHAL